MIIKVFNFTFFLLIFIMIGMIVGGTFLLKNKSEKTKKIALMCFGIFNIVFWFLYKFALFKGNPDLEAAGYKFNILLELPLHLCNISLFILPIALLSNSKAGYSYLFYISSIGALMALLNPEPYFLNNSIFTFANIGFYFTHINIIVSGVMVVTLGLFRPDFKVIPWNLLLLIILMMFSHSINEIINAKAHQPADYFFTMHNNEIGILNLFYKWVPIRFFCMFPSLLILAPYIAVVTIPFYVIDKKKNNKSDNSDNLEVVTE